VASEEHQEQHVKSGMKYASSASHATMHPNLCMCNMITIQKTIRQYTEIHLFAQIQLLQLKL
jgi:hypothetical protein